MSAQEDTSGGPLTQDDKDRLYSMLTPQERQAMEDTPSEHEAEALKSIGARFADDDDANNENGTVNEDDENANADPASGAPGENSQSQNNQENLEVKQGEATADPVAQKQNTQPDTDDDIGTAMNIIPLPADYADQVEANSRSKKELKEQFTAGDLSAEDYSAKLSELQDKSNELLGQKIAHDTSVQLANQAAENQWVNTLNSFYKNVQSEIDYKNNAAKMNELDEFTRALASKPENANKSMKWFIENAHNRVLALNGITKTQATQPSTPTANAKPEKPNTQRTPPAPPTTLSHAPNTSGPDIGTDEFAWIDRLNGQAYEQAIEKLRNQKPEEYARYMATA